MKSEKIFLAMQEKQEDAYGKQNQISGDDAKSHFQKPTLFFCHKTFFNSNVVGIFIFRKYDFEIIQCHF